MTPMRETFVAVLRLLEQDDPATDQVVISQLLVAMLDHARDAEEAGAAAKFAAAAMLYLQDIEKGEEASIDLRRADLGLQTHMLTSVMLLRRGKLKEDPETVNTKAA